MKRKDKNISDNNKSEKTKTQNVVTKDTVPKTMKDCEQEYRDFYKNYKGSTYP